MYMCPLISLGCKTQWPPDKNPVRDKYPVKNPSVARKIRLQYKYWFYSVLNPKAKPQLGLTSYIKSIMGLTTKLTRC